MWQLELGKSSTDFHFLQGQRKLTTPIHACITQNKALTLDHGTFVVTWSGPSIPQYPTLKIYCQLRGSICQVL